MGSSFSKKNSHFGHSFYQSYINFNPLKTFQKYKSKPDTYWKRVGQGMVFSLFQEMAKRVPAYQKFLKKNKINPEKIKTYRDLRHVPPIDKSSYIDKYKVNELCWDGVIENSYMLSASSGSTGLPYFWPRSEEQTMRGALISEQIYKEYFHMDTISTLYIVAFGMGTWIAGTYMMMVTDWFSQKGNPVTVVTPGLNIPDILRLVKMGKQYYKQIVLIGYPPHIKDIVDIGAEKGINWKSCNIRFMFAGEAFTEKWREHLRQKAAFKNIYTDAINIYGSADVGLIAHETPVTIFLRRQASRNKKLSKALFHAERVPSVNQFDPRFRYFESPKGELLVSTRSGIPLTRYNTKDIGNVLYFEDSLSILQESGFDIKAEFKRLKLSRFLWRLPMVYLFGRGKFTATIYAVTVYPENIKSILENSAIEKKLTGKFILQTKERKNHLQYLLLRIELSHRVRKSPKLQKKILAVFLEELPKLNSEYRHLLEAMKKRVHPKVVLHEYGDAVYFPRGVIRKSA